VTHRFDEPKKLQDRLPGSAEPNRPELEQQAVEAIRQHRCLVDSAQILYDEWIDLADDPKTPATVTRAMQADYVSRQRQISEQQDALADMLTVLGYIPNTGNNAG
jgi:chromosome condensin MukBEF MukE localization factor